MAAYVVSCRNQINVSWTKTANIIRAIKPAVILQAMYPPNETLVYKSNFCGYNSSAERKGAEFSFTLMPGEQLHQIFFEIC